MASNSILDWDDLRLVMAVAEEGAISRAARRLRLSHPTLSRRLRLMEERLGTRLFERTPTACRPTQAGEEIRDLAARMGDEIAALEARLAGRDISISGSVRLTAPDAVTDYLLPGMLAEVCRERPELLVELVVSNQTLSLAERAADIALRVTNAPDPALKGRRVGTVAMAVYAERTLAAKHRDAASTQRPWVGFDGSLACTGPGAWISENVPDNAIRFRANTLPGAAKAVRSGIGFGVLPCFVGGSIPELTAVSPPIAALETGLWLLLHPEIARIPRIRAACDALAAKLKAAAPLLFGQNT
jgi:DNA-binding transcriptional LysR family regulator